MKKIITLTLLASSLMWAAEISEIGVNIGMSHIPYTQTNSNGSITLGNEPEQNFTSYELFTTLKGVFPQDDVKPYISYNYAENSELKHQYILVGLNKYFAPTESLSLYAGMLAGFGELSWSYNPLNNSKENTYEATSVMVGVQAGVNYPLTSNILLNLNLKTLVHNYETNLDPNNTARAELKHNYTTTAMIGLAYKF